MYINLHHHTVYSILDGLDKIDDYLKRVKELGQNACAITDHGNMYGAIEFYQKAKKENIKPIIGCEVYVAPHSRFDKDSKGRKYYHLVLLCENMVGYKNLIKLVSVGNEEGYYYKPRVDFESLEKHHEGLIALSACLAGELAIAAQESYEKAKEIAIKYSSLFGKNHYFLELQDHMDGSKEQAIVNKTILRLKDELHLPVVATNDSHYAYPEDEEAHDVLLCMQTGKTLDDPDRMRYDGGQYYVKSEEEMLSLFSYCKEAVENTKKIADMCNLEFEFGNYKIPKFDIPEGFESAKEYLSHLCDEGYRKKYACNDFYSEEKKKEIYAGMKWELGIIEQMGFVEYILIVWDYINWANTHGCKTGPGRGSAAGSKVCYCIGITNVDPVRYNLFFERFLNPERVSMPDIDVDFEDSERLRVINDYIFKKYGENNVSQITTFQNMKAKAVLKDVGKVLGIPFSETNKITKMIPNELKMSIEKALQINPELKDYVENGNDLVKKWFEYAQKLENTPKATSVHAAGVVIYPQRADECMPLGRAKDGTPACEYNMVQLEELGYLKMDFLGLRTLTVIKDTVNKIKARKGINIDIDNINLDDPKVLEFIGTGKTSGVFQLESDGMQSFMKELKPQSFEDIIAGISLYRPGPMDFIPAYIKGKNDPEHIVYDTEYLRPILKDTYGTIVYQEQVMMIFTQLAGYSMGGADNIRRAMSKKKQYVIDAERKTFVYGDEKRSIKGCMKNGISEEVANKIYDSMIDFAKYAFNKSHAAAYAVISMQTAYLKYYYPVEYMASLLTSVIDKSDKLAGYMQVVKKEGIYILPPTVNKSYAFFEPEEDSIRFALGGIKGVGTDLMNRIVADRTDKGLFQSVEDFIVRALELGGNKKCFESLIKAGAFDSFEYNRHQLLDSYEKYLEFISKDKAKNVDGQMSFFDYLGETSPEKKFFKMDVPLEKEYEQRELLKIEKEVCGVYISAHPLDRDRKGIEKYGSLVTKHLIRDDNGSIEAKDGESASICGIITTVKITYTKKDGRPMAFVTLEDLYGTCSVVIFPDTYAEYKNLIKIDEEVLIKGNVSYDDEKDASLIGKEVILFDSLPKTVWIQFADMNEYKQKQKECPTEGVHTLACYIRSTKKVCKKRKSIEISDEEIERLKNIFGATNVAITW